MIILKCSSAKQRTNLYAVSRAKRIEIGRDGDKEDFNRKIALLDILDIWCEEEECHQNKIFLVIIIYELIFFVTQNNFSGKYKNKIISNISTGIFIFILICNGFLANNIHCRKPCHKHTISDCMCHWPRRWMSRVSLFASNAVSINFFDSWSRAYRSPPFSVLPSAVWLRYATEILQLYSWTETWRVFDDISWIHVSQYANPCNFFDTVFFTLPQFYMDPH